MTSSLAKMLSLCSLRDWCPVCRQIPSTVWAVDVGITLCLKNYTGVAHYNFNTHYLILIIIRRDFVREHDIKRWLVIPLLLTHVSAWPGKTWNPPFVPFQSYQISKTTLFGLLCLRKSTNFNFLTASSYGVWAITSLFIFLCHLAITSLINY